MKKLSIFFFFVTTFACNNPNLSPSNTPENYFKLDNKIFDLKYGYGWRLVGIKNNQLINEVEIRLTNFINDDWDKPWPNSNDFIYVDFSFHDSDNNVSGNTAFDGKIDKSFSIGLNEEVEMIFFTKGGKFNYVRSGKLSVKGSSVTNLSIQIEGMTSNGETINVVYNGVLKAPKL